MSSKSSGFRVRRSLSFEEVPYAGKTFYIDVRAASLKSKICQRVLNLGGQIENFLSKDLSLLISDKDATILSKGTDERLQSMQIQTRKVVPLSRGQALLLKASANQKCDANNNSHGLLQSASKLGVQTQTPATFLRASSKLLAKLKSHSRTNKQDKDSLCGMSPITWDTNKENGMIIKVEDEDRMYRPLFKHFDTFPKISYNETGSPFDVGVVLSKAKQGNQTRKKCTGGYCESCDHWYKCSLRDHLNSEKHKVFISMGENFKSLSIFATSLPNMSNFVGKYGLRDVSVQSDEQYMENGSLKFGSSIPVQVHEKLLSVLEENSYLSHHLCYVGSKGQYVLSDPMEGQNNMSRDVLESKEVLKANCDDSLDNALPDNVAHGAHLLPECPVDILESNLRQTVPTARTDASISNLNLVLSCDKSQRINSQLSIDDVIKSVAESDDEYYSSGDEDFVTKQSCIITKHITSNMFSVELVSQNLSSLVGINNIENKENAYSDKENKTFVSKDNSEKDIRAEGVSKSLFVPEAAFSSASCSFGDNGVGDAISLLISQHSNNNCDKAGRISNTNGFCNETICISSSIGKVDKLSSKVMGRSEISLSNQACDLTNIIDKDIVKENAVTVLEEIEKVAGQELGHCLMPICDSSDSEFGGENTGEYLMPILKSHDSDLEINGKLGLYLMPMLDSSNSDLDGKGTGHDLMPVLHRHDSGFDVKDTKCELMPMLDNFDSEIGLKGTGHDYRPVINEKETGCDLMPVHDSYDSEEKQFCGSAVSREDTNKTNTVTMIPFPEYSNITEDSIHDKPQIDNQLEHILQTHYAFPVVNCSTYSFGENANTDTPNKKHMDNLKLKIYDKHANSGSTIRNWLLPNDDCNSIRSCLSPGNINVTLINTSCNVSEIHGNEDIGNCESGNTCTENLNLSSIKQTGDSSKVAEWIQKQEFVVTENSELEISIQDKHGKDNTEKAGNDIHEFNVINDLEILDEEYTEVYENGEKSGLKCFNDIHYRSQSKYGSEKENMEVTSSSWSDSATSITDCTLDNFRVGGGIDMVENDISTSSKNTEDTYMYPLRKLDSEVQTLADNVSCASNASVKSCLSSTVTSRGIKIVGLSSLSSLVDEGVNNNWNNFAESTHVLSNRDSGEAEYHSVDGGNKMFPDVGSMASEILQDVRTIDNQLSNGIGHQRSSKQCSFTNPNIIAGNVGDNSSHLQTTVAGNQPGFVGSGVVDFQLSPGQQVNNFGQPHQANLDKRTVGDCSVKIQKQSLTVQKQVSQQSGITKPSAKTKGPTKGKQPRAAKTTKSKKQTQYQNSLTEVLSQSLCSPISPAANPNCYTRNTNPQNQGHEINNAASQMYPFPQNQGQGINNAASQMCPFPQNQGQGINNAASQMCPFPQNQGQGVDNAASQVCPFPQNQWQGVDNATSQVCPFPQNQWQGVDNATSQVCSFPQNLEQSYSNLGNQMHQFSQNQESINVASHSNPFSHNQGQVCSGKIQHEVSFEHFQYGMLGHDPLQIHVGDNPSHLQTTVAGNQPDFVGSGVVDFLLSPGQQVNNFVQPHQANLDQRAVTQQQIGCHEPQQTNYSGQEPCRTNVHTLPSANTQYASSIFGSMDNNAHRNSHHFLSSNTNFVMNNLHIDSSAGQPNQFVHQVPVSHWNYPSTPILQSRPGESLQTIEMSHIADDGSGCESHFNFKIANTKRLKQSENLSKKPVAWENRKRSASTCLSQTSTQHGASNQQSVIANNSVQYGGSSPGYCGLGRPQTQGSQLISQFNSLVPNACLNKQVDNFSHASSPSHVQQLTGVQTIPRLNQYHVQQQLNSVVSQNLCEVQSHQEHGPHSVNIYNTVQTGDTRLTFHKMPASNPVRTTEQPKHDLMQYWNVRKAGGCRLVFSTNVLGKRKAEEETPPKAGYSTSHGTSTQGYRMESVQPEAKRRRCLVY